MCHSRYELCWGAKFIKLFSCICSDGGSKMDTEVELSFKNVLHGQNGVCGFLACWAINILRLGVALLVFVCVAREHVAKVRELYHRQMFENVSIFVPPREVLFLKVILMVGLLVAWRFEKGDAMESDMLCSAIHRGFVLQLIGTKLQWSF